MHAVGLVFLAAVHVTLENQVGSRGAFPTGSPLDPSTLGHRDVHQYDYELIHDHAKHYIIDTDAGSDDGVGILHVLGAEAIGLPVKVVAITAVNGNTNVDNVGRNVLKILKTAQRLDIPIYKGMNRSILVTPETDDFYGSDGFGDFPFPDPPSEDLIPKVHAVNALVELVSSRPGQLTLICLGPLTNIAMAIKLYPHFLEEVEHVFILGGSTEGVGNTRPGVEFNFHIDPDAVFIVLNEAARIGKPVTLVPWEAVAVRGLIDMDWRLNVLGSISSAEIKLLNQAEVNQLSSPTWTAADSILSAVALEESLILSSGIYHVDVETCGRLSRASLFVGYEHTAGNETKNVEIVKEVDINKFKEGLMTTLNPRGGATNGA